MKTRLVLLLAVATVAALAIAGAAQAHVTVHPNALPADGFMVINIQVPNERGNASTVRIDVQFPNGIYIASPTVMPGWRSRVITKKLSMPVEIERGFSVSSRVDRVVFSGGRIGPGQFLSFPVSIKAPAVKAGTLLTFKALLAETKDKRERKVRRAFAGDRPALLHETYSGCVPVCWGEAGGSSRRTGGRPPVWANVGFSG